MKAAALSAQEWFTTHEAELVGQPSDDAEATVEHAGLHARVLATGQRALCFSSSGYTRDALAFAWENDVALFVVRYQEGRLVPHGSLAQQYLANGLHPVHQR